MSEAKSFSIYVSGAKEHARTHAQEQANSQGVPFGHALSCLIDSLPGDRVSFQFSGSVYVTAEGKTGGTGSASFSSDTMDKLAP